MKSHIIVRLPLVLALALALPSLLLAADQEWFTHETEHFRFIYRASDQEAAAIVAGFAEEVYHEVTSFLGSAPPRVDVVLYGESDFANGFYTPAPPQHIAMYTRPPTSTRIGPRSESWLRILLIHELVHYVQANYSPGLFAGVGAVFGRSLSGLQLGLTPLWFIEGLAILAETELSQGGRGRDETFEMQYAAPIAESRMFSLAQAGYPSHLAPVGRHYPAGYMIWRYLYDEYGPDVAGQILADLSSRPLFGVHGPIRRVTGERMPQIYQRAVDAAREATASDASAGRRITDAVRSDYYAPRAAGSRIFTFRTRADRLPAIIEIDPDTGDEAILVETNLTDSASWSVSADGTTIAVATITSDRSHPDQPLVMSDIYVVDRETGAWDQITSGGGYHHPTFAADGSSVFAVQRVGQASQVVSIDLDTGAQETVYSPDGTSVYTPVASSDGELLAAVANRNGHQYLVLVDLRTKTSEVVRSLPQGAPYAPRFEDRRTIVFASDAGGRLSLYRHRIDTGATVLIAEDPVAVLGGVVIGDSVVYSAYTADGHAVRASALVEGPLPAVESDPDAAPSAPSAPATLDGSRYRAVPVPRYWLPSISIASMDLDFAAIGAGVSVYGADYLGRNEFAAFAHYFPVVVSADYFGAYAYRLGRFGFGIEHGSTVTIESGEVSDREYASAADLSFTLASRFALGVGTSATVGVGAAHSVSRTLGHSITPLIGVSFTRTPSSPRNAVYAPAGIAAAANAAALFADPGLSFSGVAGLLSFGVVAGLGGSWTTVLRPSFTIGSSADAVAPFALTGFETLASETATASAKLQLELRSPKLLFDLPLFRNTGITGQSYGLFVESTSSATGTDIAVDPAISVAAEITTDLTFLTVIPIAAGVRAQIPIDGEAFSFGDDIKFYVSTDLIQSIPDLP